MQLAPAMNHYTYDTVLMLLRFATQFSQYHIKTSLFILKKVQSGSHTFAARKTFLMPTPALGYAIFLGLESRVVNSGKFFFVRDTGRSIIFEAGFGKNFGIFNKL